MEKGLTEKLFQRKNVQRKKGQRIKGTSALRSNGQKVPTEKGPKLKKQSFLTQI